MRFFVFIAIIATLLSLSSFYLGHTLIARFSFAEAHGGIVWLSLGTFVFLQILGPYLYRAYPDRFSRLFVLHWLTYTTLGVFACMLLYTMAADLLIWTGRVIFHYDDVHFERLIFIAVAAMALISVVVGVLQATTGPRMYHVDIPMKGLPGEWDGFTIAQVSDVHVGPTIGRNYMETIVKAVNDISPDMVALTGDFVDGSVARLKNAIAPIGQINAKHGVYFVTGNHEYYWGVHEWIDEFQRLGARVLLNEHVVILQNGCPLVVAGVTDYSAGQMVPSHHSDPAKSVEGAPEKVVKILLAHQPSSYRKAFEAGFDLQISGHTHGGQFFPWSIFVALSHRYYKGLNKHESMWIYVSRGAGYWGPPLRFTIPSEITLIRLKCADSQMV